MHQLPHLLASRAALALCAYDEQLYSADAAEAVVQQLLPRAQVTSGIRVLSTVDDTPTVSATDAAAAAAAAGMAEQILPPPPPGLPCRLCRFHFLRCITTSVSVNDSSLYCVSVCL